MGESSQTTGADTKSSMDVFFDKTANVLKKVMSPERATELLAAQVMMALEISHDMSLYPAKYALRPEQVSPLPTDPIMYELVDNIGDIWEISAGHTTMRLGFVALNEALKSAPVKKLQRNLLQNDGIKKVAGKLMGGGDRVEELAEGADIQIPDTACFWASLMTTLTVKAVHSLGYISLFGIHDHMDAPVPGMLFGQGVAAIVLATTHYAAKNREPIKNFALKVGGKVVDGAKSFDKMMNSLSDPRPAKDAKLDAEAMKKEPNRVEIAFEKLQKRTESFLKKVQEWDPNKYIPTPEAIIDKLLSLRISKAKANLAEEHTDLDQRQE